MLDVLVECVQVALPLVGCMQVASPLAACMQVASALLAAAAVAVVVDVCRPVAVAPHIVVALQCGEAQACRPERSYRRERPAAAAIQDLPQSEFACRH